MTDHSVILLSPQQAEARRDELVDLLVDAVEGGASVNFIWPMTQMLMISPTALQANAGSDNGQKWAAENVVGTGPFLISSRTKGSETIMKRFDGYWRGWTGNHVDSVVVKVAKEATTRRLMLERGEAQVANNIAVTDLAPLESNKDIAVSHVQGPGVQMAAARFRGPLKDVVYQDQWGKPYQGL